MNQNNNKRKIILGVIFIIIIILCVTFILNSNNTNQEETTIYESINIDESKLNIFYFNVGQADSTLIMHEGKTILIDAGNGSDGEEIVKFIKAKGIEKIDYVIGTHIHEDHIGGMKDIVNNILIGQIFMPYNKTITADFYEELIDIIEVKGSVISTVNEKEQFYLNEKVKFQILFVDNTEPSEPNNASIVVQLTYGEQEYLFMGDAEEIVENKLLKNAMLQDIDVLKVGHHGSNTSTTEEFVNKILPEVSIISVQEGVKYKDMPNEDVIKRLEEKGKVYRTDTNGTIWLISDGIINTIAPLQQLNLNGANKIGLRVYFRYARF